MFGTDKMETVKIFRTKKEATHKDNLRVGETLFQQGISVKGAKKYVVGDFDQMWEYSKDCRYLHEGFLPDTPVKLCFDLDIKYQIVNGHKLQCDHMYKLKCVLDDFIDHFNSTFNKTVTREDFILLKTEEQPEKVSIHGILQGFAFPSMIHQKQFILDLFEKRPDIETEFEYNGFDMDIYGEKSLRVLGSRKKKNNFPLKLFNLETQELTEYVNKEQWFKSLASYTVDCELLHMEIKKKKKKKEIVYKGDTSKELICKLIDILSEKYYTKRSLWLAVGNVLYNSGCDFEMFDTFSKKSNDPKHQDIEGRGTIEKWESFSSSDLKFDIGLLHSYARESDSQAYSELMQTNLYDDKNYESWKVKWESDFFLLTNSTQLVYTKFENLRIETCDSVNIYKKFGILNETGRYFKEFKQIGDDMIMFTDMWLRDLNKRQYSIYDWLPEPAEQPFNVYNTWKGFNKKPKPEVDNTSVIKIFNEFMKHIGKQTPGLSDFLIFYIADMIQNPGRKPGILLIFTGPEGTYKGTIFDLIKSLIGEYAKQTSDSKKVFTRFNSILDKNLFLNLNEALTIEMINNSGILKSLTTDTEMQYEQKGIETRCGSNFTRVMISTNVGVGAKASINDRRNVYIDTEPMSSELRTGIRSIIDDPVSSLSLFYYLKEQVFIPYKSSYDWQNNRPITKKHEEVIEQFRDPLYYCMLEILENQNENKVYYTNGYLYNTYEARVTATRYHIKDKKTFSILIGKIQGFTRKRNKTSRGFLVDKKESIDYLVDNKLICIEEIEEIDGCYTVHGEQDIEH